MSTRRFWVLACVMVTLVGCGDDTSQSGPGAEAPEWKPAFTDPGGDVFLYDATTGATPRAEKAVRTVLAELDEATLRGKVTVDYPKPGSVFPPDLCAPTFLWHDSDNTVNAWLIDVAFEGHPKHVYAVTSGVRKRRETDPRCVTNANAWTEPAYQASAKAWTPDERTWSIIKQRSVERKATVTVYGLVGTHGAAGTRTPVSVGSVEIITSKDPVGAQVFYRDVPLMPSETKDGIIKPLKKSALPLIKWRLRDLSKPEAPVVMEHLPTCANCHTFSADGKTLAMDMDGPDGDKGAHVVKTIAKRTVIGRDDVFSWNRLTERVTGKQSFGLFPQISPDGQTVVATVHEDVYVMNYLQYDFLQTFYPTRGILAFYSRKTGSLRTLPGADDPQFVQSNATWSPDGTELVFIRAEAGDAYTKGPRAKAANDPNERQIQYDLYRIDFNGGKGGVPEPVKGAYQNGMSNSFPRFSPDGKWIVFVQAKNGLLMRPDGKLYIIPAEGGEARLMNCNTPRMNSYHSFSPNGRWMVFSSKWPTPYTQMYLTHIDADGNDTPAILVPNSTAANRAVNLPEFAKLAPGALEDITTPAVDYRRHIERAEALQKKGRLAEAMTEVRKSLALKSDYPNTYLAYGYLLEAEKKPIEALAQYRRALEIEPRFFAAHNNMGATLMRLGRLPEALANFRAALKVNPKMVKALVNLGDALNRLNKPEEAVVHLRKAVEIEPENGNAHFNLGVSHLLMNKKDDAVVDFTKAVEANPNDASAHNNLGSTFRDLGRSKEAVVHYRHAIRLDPHYAITYDSLAWILATCRDASVRDGAEALRLARIACERTRYRDAACLMTLAAAHAETGDYDTAVRTAERALRLADTQRNTRTAEKVRRHLVTLKQKKPLRD